MNCMSCLTMAKRVSPWTFSWQSVGSHNNEFKIWQLAIMTNCYCGFVFLLLQYSSTHSTNSRSGELFIARLNPMIRYQLPGKHMLKTLISSSFTLFCSFCSDSVTLSADLSVLFLFFFTHTRSPSTYQALLLSPDSCTHCENCSSIWHFARGWFTQSHLLCQWKPTVSMIMFSTCLFP